MGGIFDGLEAFGLEDFKGLELADKKPEKEETGEKKEVDILDFIFEKSMHCPVCDKPFKANTVKGTKVKLEGIDDDLMPSYSPVDPLLYDVLICPSCGYSSLRLNFSAMNDRQSELILQTITPKYTHKPHPVVMDIDTAIGDYKLALLCAVVKKGRSSEKAYICMKLSWLYKRKGDSESELLFIKQAYESFGEAYTKDAFPFCGLNQNTVDYVMARFALKLGYYSDASRTLSKLLSAQGLSPQIKDRALDMKNMLRAKEKNS